MVLEKVTALPVETWRYRDEIDPSGKRHIGTYAEDFQRGFGLGDGKSLERDAGFGFSETPKRRAGFDLAA